MTNTTIPRSATPDNLTPLYNVYRYDQTNIGDSVLSPLFYFDHLRRGEIIDVEAHNFNQQVERVRGADVVIGGSLYKNFKPGFEQVRANKPKHLIAWGLGHNDYGTTEVILPSFLEEYDLVGLRDYGTKYEWVPCASCMRSELENVGEPQHDIVVYDHKSRPLPDTFDQFPRYSNEGNSIGRAMSFLKSGETILTNSYHGAYWGILMGRKVVVLNPFSTKFLGLKYPIPQASAEDWQRAVNNARPFPEALQETRSANRSFATKVSELIAA